MAQPTYNKSDGSRSAGLTVRVVGDCTVCLSDKPRRSVVLVRSFCLQKVWKRTPITKAAWQRHQAARNLGTASEQKSSRSLWKIFGKRKHCRGNQGTWMTDVCSAENWVLLLQRWWSLPVLLGVAAVIKQMTLRILTLGKPIYTKSNINTLL